VSGTPPRSSTRRREALEHVTQAEQLVDVAGRQPGNPHAAPGQVVDEALLAEQPQRLAQRRG
jgi:hypothetical protein